MILRFLVTIIFLFNGIQYAQEKTQANKETQDSLSIKVGDKCPLYSTRDIEGNLFSVNNFSKSQVIILNFFATWCVPCRGELPALLDLVQKHKNDKLIVYLISKGKDTRSELLEFKTKEKLTDFIIIRDCYGMFSQKFGINNIPVTLVLDQKGNVREIFNGADADFRIKLEKIITVILEEKR